MKNKRKLILRKERGISTMEEFEKLKNKFKNSNKYVLTLDYEEIKRLIEITENLIADNKRLDKENQALFEAYNFNDTNLLAKTLKEYRKEILNSIPKSKVREKIEKYKWAIEHYDCDEADYKQSQAVGAWNVLYRLLQEGDK